MSISWQEAERIRDLPQVDETITNFAQDPTGDNAVGMVQAIIDASNEEPVAHLLRIMQAFHEDDEPNACSQTADEIEKAKAFLKQKGYHCPDYWWENQ